MSLVDVVLDNGELLHSPFAHIDQSLNLCSCSSIKPLHSLLKLVLKLAVVAVDEAENIHNLIQTLSDDLRLLIALEL